VCENQLWEKEQMSKEPHLKIKKDFARWIVSLFIGILTALVGCFIAISIEEISYFKYSWLQQGSY
jgi:chloride channel 7